MLFHSLTCLFKHLPFSQILAAPNSLLSKIFLSSQVSHTSQKTKALICFTLAPSALSSQLTNLPNRSSNHLLKRALTYKDSATPNKPPEYLFLCHVSSLAVKTPPKGGLQEWEKVEPKIRVYNVICKILFLVIFRIYRIIYRTIREKMKTIKNN